MFRSCWPGAWSWCCVTRGGCFVIASVFIASFPKSGFVGHLVEIFACLLGLAPFIRVQRLRTKTSNDEDLPALNLILICWLVLFTNAFTTVRRDVRDVRTKASAEAIFNTKGASAGRKVKCRKKTRSIGS